jgi:hypothetical protein
LWFDNYNALQGGHDEKVRLLTLAHYPSVGTQEEWAKAKTEVRSKLDMALMMSSKRVLYEARPVEREDDDGLQYVGLDTSRQGATTSNRGGQIAFPWQ